MGCGGFAKGNENEGSPELFVSKITFHNHLKIKENPVFTDFTLCVMSKYLGDSSEKGVRFLHF